METPPAATPPPAPAPTLTPEQQDKIRQTAEAMVRELEATFIDPASCQQIVATCIGSDVSHVMHRIRQAQDWGSQKALSQMIRALALYYLMKQGDTNPALLPWNLLQPRAEEPTKGPVTLK